MSTQRMRRLTLIRQLKDKKGMVKNMQSFIGICLLAVGSMAVILWALGTGRMDWVLK